MAWFIYLVISLAYAFGFGIATMKISQSKGYDGGFLWGFLLGFIGLIVVLCKPNCKNDPVPSTSTRSPQGPYSWKCAKCGLYNTGYRCQCGLYKGESTQLEKEKSEQKQARIREEIRQANAVKEETVESGKDIADSELENLKKIRLCKELLDCGAITQEEFDRKKAEYLNLK